MPIEIRHIILPTIIEERQVDYKVFCNKNTEIPPMNIGHIRIKNSVENKYIGTPVELAKKGIIVKPGIANDSYITIMNISNRNVKFNKGQHIGNVEKIQKNDEIFLMKLPDLKDQSEKEKERILILKNQCEKTGGPGTWNQIVNTNEIPPIELNLKNGMKENKIPMREKRQALRKYSKEDKKGIKEMQDDLMKSNIIFSGNTEWGSSALVITKKDRTKKIAIDYRNLNKYLEQYREPLPDSKKMLQTVSRYKYYITMDIKSAYWQLVMHENSKKYTATTFAEYGTYCWHTLSFGISTAPAYLIRAINKILGYLDYVNLKSSKQMKDDVEKIINELPIKAKISSEKQIKNILKEEIECIKFLQQEGILYKNQKCWPCGNEIKQKDKKWNFT
ncbi:23552_t:CDS:2 [Cetraspora pellucida]|uniref:23552_t:CDS:1 n=1 Tax=Cetraspora pellucida TaxID=1433469 RepID=A0A9N8Z9L2_9GLOM|nr:23552_t:CDS:2 [Cetraspora pellucida]